jgi:hypothetical protein
MIISPFLIPITAIVCAFIYAIVKTLAYSRVRELQIRERIAMIERGLVPAPEVDPRGFDHAMSRLEARDERVYRRTSSSRHRRAGVTMMGIGFGLMVLIAFTSGEESVAIGVGGFLVLIGIAFFINSLIDPYEPPLPQRPWSQPTPPSTPAEPPRHD